MPSKKVDPEVSRLLLTLSKEELIKILSKALQKDKSLHDFVYVNYLDPIDGPGVLYEQAIQDIQLLKIKSYKGHTFQQRFSRMLGACTKRINEFDKICKQKELVLDLLLYMLDEIRSINLEGSESALRGTKRRVYLLLKKALVIYSTKIHPDLQIEYRTKINTNLHHLHTHSNHIDYIYSLPESL